MFLDGDRRVLAGFAGMSLFAGGNAVAIRFSNRELAPLWGATSRFAVATLLLVLIAAATRVSLPRGRLLAASVLWGLIQFAGGFGLAYYALVRVHAGLGQTLLALTPLATLLVAVLERQERLRAVALAGTLTSLVGVALISRDPLREAVPLLSLLAVLGSVLCFAQAGVLARRLSDVHPVALNTVGAAAATVALLAASAIAGDARILPDRTATWVALLYVGGVGSVVVFLLYVYVIQQWSASRAAYSLAVIPFVTVALSAWLDDEPVGIGFVGGGLLVLLGVYVGALRRAPSSAPARAP